MDTYMYVCMPVSLVAPGHAYHQECHQACHLPSQHGMGCSRLIICPSFSLSECLRLLVSSAVVIVLALLSFKTQALTSADVFLLQPL